MALVCTTPALQSGAASLEQSLTHKGLLAALVYVLCQVNNMSCTPQSLASLSECFRCGMTEKGLLAAAVYILCNNGSGGGGSGGSVQVLQYTGATPTADGLVPASINSPAIAYKSDGSDATYSWNTTSHTWNP
jgi:hypothetical protein